MKICIIGGGASGLYCALQIKQKNPNADVTILERQPRVGKKLLATGNGKCNFTNTAQDISHYTTQSPAKVQTILAAHGVEDIIAQFSLIGVEAIKNGTLVYPRSLQAASVLDALRFKNEALGTKLITDCNVKSIKKTGAQFTIQGDVTHTADAVVIAGGSSAGGGSGCGIKLLRSFGHSAAPTYPALVPVCCDTTHTKLAKGMRTQCTVQLYRDNTPIAKESGEVLFTEYGLSGICIMQLSRHIAQSKAQNEKSSFHFLLDLAPEADTANLQEYLHCRRTALAHLTIGDFLSGYLNKKVGQAVCKAAVISNFNASVSELSDAQLTALAKQIKAYKADIKDTLDAAHAQACGGGILLNDFDMHLSSEKVSGLYACGEVLDVLGDCGGYNLTWAWASAYAVACGIAKQI